MVAVKDCSARPRCVARLALVPDSTWHLSDGNLWFTLYHGMALGRITVNGRVTLYHDVVYPSDRHDFDSVAMIVRDRAGRQIGNFSSSSCALETRRGRNRLSSRRERRPRRKCENPPALCCR
jgi:hypothetical protein